MECGKGPGCGSGSLGAGRETLGSCDWGPGGALPRARSRSELGAGGLARSQARPGLAGCVRTGRAGPGLGRAPSVGIEPATSRWQEASHRTRLCGRRPREGPLPHAACQWRIAWPGASPRSPTTPQAWGAALWQLEQWCADDSPPRAAPCVLGSQWGPARRAPQLAPSTRGRGSRPARRDPGPGARPRRAGHGARPAREPRQITGPRRFLRSFSLSGRSGCRPPPPPGEDNFQRLRSKARRFGISGLVPDHYLTLYPAGCRPIEQEGAQS